MSVLKANSGSSDSVESDSRFDGFVERRLVRILSDAKILADFEALNLSVSGERVILWDCPLMSCEIAWGHCSRSCVERFASRWWEYLGE